MSARVVAAVVVLGLAAQLAGCAGSSGGPNGPVTPVAASPAPAAPANTLAIFPATLPTAAVGDLYMQTLTTNGVELVDWEVTGVLPPGLVPDFLGPNNAAMNFLDGTCTTPGTYTFTVEVIDANGARGSRTYTLTVGSSAPGTPFGTFTMSPASGTVLAPATIGVAYSQTFTVVSGGVAPLAFHANGILPPGLTLVSAGSSAFMISGTPTAAWSGRIRVEVFDSAGFTEEEDYQLDVS